MLPPWMEADGTRLPGWGRATFVETVRSALAADPAGWSIDVRPPFCLAAPRDRPLPNQGWKLHVSATAISASAVLARVLPILVEHRSHFKLVRSLGELSALNDVHAPEGSAGKFVTVYPRDDAEAVAMARACDVATDGLTGPRILSDRALRPGSLVHYRYGAFARQVRWTLLEQLEDIVFGPDGDAYPDARGAGFAPPVWAVDPFAREAEPDASATAGDGSVRLGAYRVERVIARSNRGGLYRATGPAGARVVIKEARPHVSTDRFGRDARDRLRHEARVLGLLAQGSVCPEPVELFEHGGHYFLAMADVGRRSLREEIVRGAAGRGQPLGEQDLGALALRLAALLRAVHGIGVVVRDLNPGNLVRGGDGLLRLVDLEAAHYVDDPVPWYRAATPAYASPQQADNLRPAAVDDVYSFGATLFFAATGTDPFFLADGAEGRTSAQKLDEVLSLHAPAPWAQALIGRCLAPSPGDRPGMEEIVAAIERRGEVVFPVPAPPEPTVHDVGHAVDGVVAYLAAARAARDGDRLWPTTPLGERTDPLNVANGNAGVGLVLCQAAASRPQALEPLAEAARITREAVQREPDRPAGLLFGRAGVAWFLETAGHVLDEPLLIDAAVRLARTLPETLGSPDLAQGTAGLCLLAARFALLTGDPDMARRARVAGDALVGAMTETPFGPGWVVPPTHTADGRAKVYPGFAFGATGVAYALLAAARATGDERYSARAMDALSGVVQAGRAVDGDWYWPTSADHAPGAPGWLKGAAGIGAGMVRAWALTGEPRFREAALGCLRLLKPVPAGAPLVQFHGLAGVGEFLLDCRSSLPEADVGHALRGVVQIILAQRVDRRAEGFGVCFPDEEGFAGADFGTGVSGVGSFLLRHFRGGPRPMTLDDLPIGGEVPSA